jgi:hypothetical protein
VERWLRSVCHRDIDFEIDDALAKLRGMELVESAPLLRSQPLPEALARLDRRWDDLFRHQSDGGTVPVTGQ